MSTPINKAGNQEKQQEKVETQSSEVDVTTRVNAKVTFLKTKIDKQIAGFQKRRDGNRRRAFWTRISTSVLGVAVTVLLGLRISGLQEGFSNIALVLSGTITVLNALEGFFSYRTLWIRYTVTTNQLHALQADLEYLLTVGQEFVREEDVDELYHRYSSILEETNKMWIDSKKEQESSPPA